MYVLKLHKITLGTHGWLINRVVLFLLHHFMVTACIWSIKKKHVTPLVLFCKKKVFVSSKYRQKLKMANQKLIYDLKIYKTFVKSC